ncbi:SurA N-terminal domain-containing protein [uncultured Pseudacidovorax sp.]|uniref:SurA N-terminal domain-containing protein n=1 Tax=uncultured Pseudacidovorax sp. TaxID=679313 RepID=UPI0025D1BF40|nr:SurA N-terminal domain-containing protein [uncultured Pseudacidovorax sp.]
MFDFFRKYNKIVMIVLFLLIIPSFVLFGVQNYTNNGDRGDVVASVDGQSITRTEWEQQHRNETDRLRQQMPSLDASVFDSDAARYATLERMVRNRVLTAAALKTNMTVSDGRLTRVFTEDPGLASFRDDKGNFDRQRFIMATGRTPEQFEAAVRADLATQQLLGGVTGSAAPNPALLDVLSNALRERREVQVARFAPADFAGKVSVSDADLEAYYKSHTSRYQLPEQADVEYIVLNMDAVKKTIAVPEADLKAYYDQNKDRFGTKEERKASHILIAAGKDAPAADRAKAKARAEELLAEVRKTPSSFGDLAKKNSQDPVSAAQGGALDFVTRGAMVKPFEDAMFALKKGEISNVVETEYGYHIIRLDDIKPAVVPPFEQVRARIEDEIRGQQASQAFAKQAEVLSDLVYQQADSLQPAADALKLQIQKAQGVGRTPVSGAQGPLGNRNFINALFAADTLERKHNTEAIDLGGNQLAVGRVTRHVPARTQTFDEVKARVRQELVAERAAAAAKTEGEAKLKAWEGAAAGAVPAGLGQPIAVSRNDNASSQPSAVVEAALRADPAKLPAWVGVDLGAEGYAVVRVNKTLPPAEVPADQRQQERTQLSQAMAGAEAEAYYAMLKDRFKATIKVPHPSGAPSVVVN